MAQVFTLPCQNLNRCLNSFDVYVYIDVTKHFHYDNQFHISRRSKIVTVNCFSMKTVNHTDRYYRSNLTDVEAPLIEKSHDWFVAII